MKKIKTIPSPKCVGKRYLKLKRCKDCMIKKSCYKLYVKDWDYFKRYKRGVYFP